MADDSATIVVNPLPPRRTDIVIAHLAAPTAGAEFFYFIEDSGEIATSPIRAGDFVSLLASGRGTPSTLVWAQSLGEWTALRNVPALASMVALSDVLASSPSLASENETNDPSIVVQSDVMASSQSLGSENDEHVYVTNCVDDESTLLDVACSFVFGVAVIPILVFAILTPLAFVMIIIIMFMITVFMIIPFAGPAGCALVAGVIGAIGTYDWRTDTRCFLSHFHNAISHPSRRIAFGSGMSLFVVIFVVLLVLRKRA